MTEVLLWRKPDGNYGLKATEHVTMWANDKGVNIDSDPRNYIPYKDLIIVPTMAEAIKRVQEFIEASKPKERTLGT